MALGRGLDALLGDTTLQAQTGGSVNLPISQVEPGLNQPRKHFDEEALADLAESIRQHGMLQPLTVRRLASGYYQIIAGERRWRAARQAGLEEVPAIIIEADDRKVMELGLIENLQREDLNPMEEAAGYRTLAFVSRTCLLQEEAELEEIVQLVGMDALSAPDRLKLEAARSIREDFLHQNAFDEVDTYTPLEKQHDMMLLILQYYEKAQAALQEGADIEKLIALPVREQIGRFKYTPADQLRQAFEAVSLQLERELHEAKQTKEDY